MALCLLTKNVGFLKKIKIFSEQGIDQIVGQIDEKS